MPADLPPARPEITLRVEGWVERISGGRWTIDGITVKVTGATQIIGNPGVGWKVSAVLRQEADGSYTALQIAALAPPEATPEPYDFTDVVEAIDSEGWTIGGTLVKITGDTQFIGDPQIGDLVSVNAVRRQGEIWALRIKAVPLTEVQFRGIINSVSGSSIGVGGHTVLINNNTQIIGNPEVGRLADVVADQMADGRLIGKVIEVLDAPATPTPTATQQPTATPTLEPTSTHTPEPTPTATQEPTPTPTPEPTPTATQEPTSTPTSEPTPTATQEPTSTPTSEPTPAATQEPTSTPTSEPTP